VMDQFKLKTKEARNAMRVFLKRSIAS